MKAHGSERFCSEGVRACPPHVRGFQLYHSVPGVCQAPGLRGRRLLLCVPSVVLGVGSVPASRERSEMGAPGCGVSGRWLWSGAPVPPAASCLVPFGVRVGDVAVRGSGRSPQSYVVALRVAGALWTLLWFAVRMPGSVCWARLELQLQREATFLTRS